MTASSITQSPAANKSRLRAVRRLCRDLARFRRAGNRRDTEYMRALILRALGKPYAAGVLVFAGVGVCNG